MVVISITCIETISLQRKKNGIVSKAWLQLKRIDAWKHAFLVLFSVIGYQGRYLNLSIMTIKFWEQNNQIIFQNVMANRKCSQTKYSRGCHLFRILADLAPRLIPISITVCSFPSSLYRQPHYVFNLGKLETSFLKLLRSGVGLITDSLTVHPGWVHHCAPRLGALWDYL